MKSRGLRIAPAAERLIADLPLDLKAKIKNAIREISANGAAGPSASGAGVPRLYQGGRFRILYRRRNGLVWIDGIGLEMWPRTVRVTREESAL